MTTFLFASVATSGVRVLSYNRFTRRDRFILAAAFSFGIGDLLVPAIFTHLFDSVSNPSKGLEGLFSSITIVLETPCESRFPSVLQDQRWLTSPGSLGRRSCSHGPQLNSPTRGLG